MLTGAPRNAYVRAEGTMQLYVLGQGDLTKVLEAYPAVDQILRKAMAKRQQEKEGGEGEGEDNAEPTTESKAAAAPAGGAGSRSGESVGGGGGAGGRLLDSLEAEFSVRTSSKQHLLTQPGG
eukprot:COSAG06_NODE_6994_length_2683_cov_62.353702_3_plen_122_part_00